MADRSSVQPGVGLPGTGLRRRSAPASMSIHAPRWSHALFVAPYLTFFTTLLVFP